MSVAYDSYQRGMGFLRKGDVHAAATLFERAARDEPGKSSIHEGLARAYFRSGRFALALEQFRVVLEISPANDYAHLGAGLCLGRLGHLREAVGHLRMACVMRPESREYREALERWERHADRFDPAGPAPE